MARISIRGGGVLRCDIPGCAGRFTTYSMLRLTRSQALGAKWSRLNGKKLAGEEDGLYLKRGKVDVCPDHGELPPFVPAPKVPKERKPRKPRKPRPKMRDLAVSA